MNRLRKIYNWQKNGWPHFVYDEEAVIPLVMDYHRLSGQSQGLIKGVTSEDAIEASIDHMIEEALKTSAIEGEYLDREDVRSSLKKQLGLFGEEVQVKDQRAIGASELMLACRDAASTRLTQKMLYAWHTMIMRGTVGVRVGGYRKHADPMQVVSGALGKQKIHFEAPPSKDIPSEMRAYLKWYKKSGSDEQLRVRLSPIRSGLAHIYFESLHPFEDGNGRIGRAISLKVLSEGLSTPLLLNLSKMISEHKKEYYGQLERTQKKLDVTEWLLFFIKMIVLGQEDANQAVIYTLELKKFWKERSGLLNKRQAKAIRRMTRDGRDGFEGGINARKYMSITKASKATATRDLQDLLSQGLLSRSGQGKSTSYTLHI